MCRVWLNDTQSSLTGVMQRHIEVAQYNWKVTWQRVNAVSTGKNISQWEIGAPQWRGYISILCVIQRMRSYLRLGISLWNIVWRRYHTLQIWNILGDYLTNCKVGLNETAGRINLQLKRAVVWCGSKGDSLMASEVTKAR